MSFNSHWDLSFSASLRIFNRLLQMTSGRVGAIFRACQPKCVWEEECKKGSPFPFPFPPFPPPPPPPSLIVFTHNTTPLPRRVEGNSRTPCAILSFRATTIPTHSRLPLSLPSHPPPSTPHPHSHHAHKLLGDRIGSYKTTLVLKAVLCVLTHSHWVSTKKAGRCKACL